MPPKRSKAIPGGSSSASVSSSGRRSKSITLAVANAHRDGVRIERSVTKLCRKITILEERVSGLESECGKIRQEMAEMVQREVKEQMKTVLDKVEMQVVAVFKSARSQ